MADVRSARSGSGWPATSGRSASRAAGSPPSTLPGRSGEEQLDKEAFNFSTSTYDWNAQQFFTAYVAGGPLVVPHERITYTFPDGHTEQARIATDAAGRQWWSVAYLPTEGIMTSGNSSRWDPVKVEDALSGVVNTYRLDWFRNGCAQVNHGC